MKYAFVVSASYGYIPGVNALLNGLKYYDNDVEFHLLFWNDPEFEPYIQSVRENGFCPKLVAVNLLDYVKERGDTLSQRDAQYVLKTYRYEYCIDRLRDYDAVAILDADTVLLNNVMWAFDVAAHAEKIVLTRYSYTIPDLPYVCCPGFFKPSRYADVFGEIRHLWDEILLGSEISLRFLGDMSVLNYILAHRPDIKPIAMPNLLWGVMSWLNLGMQEVRIDECYLDDKRYLMAYGEDKINLLHAKWWIKGHIVNNLRKPESALESIRNRHLKLFWETYYFFNNKCYHNIEWQKSPWGEPSMFDEFPGFF